MDMVRSEEISAYCIRAGTRIVTAHIGAIPPEPAHPRYSAMLEACGRIAQYAASIGACYAIETGPEPSYVLKMFLEDICSCGIDVNLYDQIRRFVQPMEDK